MIQQSVRSASLQMIQDLRGAINTPDGCGGTQRDLGRLKKMGQ